MQRRELLSGAAGLALAAGLPALAQGTFPDKPIRLVVPFPPAGGTDVVSRLMADMLNREAGWSILVDNRPGAGGNIGLDIVAKSRPDGYTVGMGQTANLAINPSLYPRMPFDPLRDFAPVVLVISQPVVLTVASNSRFRSLAEVIAAARQKPGELKVALAGNGTVGHLAGDLLKRRAGIEMLNVPYKGGAPAITDMLGGSLDLFFGNTQLVTPLIDGGKLRPLAVTSLQRIAVLKDVPTVAESGYPDFEAVTWSGLVAPTGTPPEAIAALNAMANRVLRRKDTLDRIAADGSTAYGGTPEQFATYIRAEHRKWGALIRDAGIKLE